MNYFFRKNFQKGPDLIFFGPYTRLHLKNQVRSPVQQIREFQSTSPTGPSKSGPLHITIKKRQAQEFSMGICHDLILRRRWFQR